MRSLIDTLFTLAAQFAGLSMLAFGGVNSVVPEIHRQAVEVRRWMGDADFAALFALAQAAPGPNLMISTLVGWKAAGLPGAVVATLAICAPSCLLTFWVVRVWDRHRQARWRIAVAAGLAPVAVGLVGASAWLLAGGADRTALLVGVTLATAGLTAFTRLHPLWCLAAASALGVSGVLG